MISMWVGDVAGILFKLVVWGSLSLFTAMMFLWPINNIPVGKGPKWSCSFVCIMMGLFIFTDIFKVTL